MILITLSLYVVGLTTDDFTQLVLRGASKLNCSWHIKHIDYNIVRATRLSVLLLVIVFGSKTFIFACVCHAFADHEVDTIAFIVIFST